MRSFARYLIIASVTFIFLLPSLSYGARKITVKADPYDHSFSLKIAGCKFSYSISEISNIMYDEWNNRSSFNWLFYIEDGNCSGKEYNFFIYDIKYNDFGYMVSATYTYKGKIYKVKVKRWY